MVEWRRYFNEYILRKIDLILYIYKNNIQTQFNIN